MARREITKQIYLRLIAAFRDQPAAFSYAGQRAGVCRQTAKKAYECGLPRYPWGKPIREVLEAETAEAKALVEAANREVEIVNLPTMGPACLRAREAIAPRVEAGLLAKRSQVSALKLLEATQDLLDACAGLSARAKSELVSAQVDPVAAVKVVQGVGKLLRDANESAKLAVQLEKLTLGEPTEIVGTQLVTLQEVSSEIQAAQEALVRAQALGALEEEEQGSADETLH